MNQILVLLRCDIILLQSQRNKNTKMAIEAFALLRHGFSHTKILPIVWGDFAGNQL